MSRLGIPWQPGTAGPALLIVLAIAAVLRWLLPGRLEQEALPAWTAGGQTAVGLAVGASGLFGGAVLLSAFGGVSSIPQNWDAMMHANGIRYIAETGDSGVYGMYNVNSFASGGQVYYPNAYHLIATVIYDLTGATIPAVLNAQTILMPLMLALTFVALVRCFHGRVTLAVFAALVSSTATAVHYDLIWRGPLFPFATGLVLTLGIPCLVRRYLDRPSVLSAAALMLAGAGLLGLHPSMLFTAALFTLPFLVQRWWGGSLGYGPRRIGVELGLLVMPGVVIAALVAPHLNGALSAAQAVLAFVWPPEVTPAHALGEVLGFSTMQPYPQVWLLVFLVIGMAGLRSLRRLRWLPVAGAVFAGLFVLSASYSTPWAQKITSPWWNDKYRLAAVATVALLPVVAHGLVCTYDALLTRLVLPALRRLPGTSPSWAAPVSITAVCAVFLLLADGGYAQRNIQRTAEVYGPGPTVSPAERKAFGVLKELVKPGERVMNDRYDGSGWMYALDGVRPVAAHFSTQAIGDGPDLLAGNVDDYDSRPDVRAAVAQLDVKWVIVGPGFVWASMRRQGGLEQLSRVRAFDLVYDEGGVQIYQVARPVAPSAPPSSLPASVPGAGGPPGGPG